MSRTWKKTHFAENFDRTKTIAAHKQKFVKSLVGEEVEDELRHTELSVSYFLAMAMHFQMNVLSIVQTIELINLLPRLESFIIFTVLQPTLVLPLIWLFVFMSNYSRRGFLKFWECVPILSGMGYTILLTRFAYTLLFLLFASIAMLATLDLLFNPNQYLLIRICDRDVNNLCVNGTEWFNDTCPARQTNMTTYFFAMQFYVRRFLMKYDETKPAYTFINYKLIIIMGIMWLLIFFFVVLGVTRIQKVMYHLQMVFDYMIVICTVVIILGTYSDLSKYDINLSNKNVEPRSWIFILLYTTDVFILSDCIWVGTLKPKAVSIQKTTLLIGVSRMFGYFMINVYSRVSIQLMMVYYKVIDIDCMTITGFDVLFAFVPDILFRMELGLFFSALWHMGICFSAFNVSIYCVNSVVNALVERFKWMQRRRVVTYFIYCLTSFVLDVCVCTNAIVNIVFVFHYHFSAFLNVICLLVILGGLLFVYSTQRIADDYLFSSRRRLHWFYEASWKTTAAVQFFAFIFMLQNVSAYYREGSDVSYSVTFTLLRTIVCLAPTIVVFGIRCVVGMRLPGKKKTVLARVDRALAPSKEWGPRTLIKQRSRRMFLPTRELPYRATRPLRCEHNCLVSSVQLQRENLHQMANLLKLRRELELGRDSQAIRIVLREVWALTGVKRPGHDL